MRREGITHDDIMRRLAGDDTGQGEIPTARLSTAMRMIVSLRIVLCYDPSTGGLAMAPTTIFRVWISLVLCAFRLVPSKTGAGRCGGWLALFCWSPFCNNCGIQGILRRFAFRKDPSMLLFFHVA
jgi:hypothetical protein